MVAAAPATVAAAAAEGPTIEWVSRDFEGNTGVLLVSISAPESVRSVRADVKGRDGQVIATTDKFWISGGDHEHGVWATAEPFQLAELGYYQVDVTVTDEAGATIKKVDAGTLFYVVVTSFDDLEVKPAAATYDQREITISGVLPVAFQYSATGTGDWVTAGEDDEAYWSGEGYEFEARLTDTRSGFWRARYPGRSDMLEPAVSRRTRVD